MPVRGLLWYVLKRVLAIVIVVFMIATAIFFVLFLHEDPANELLPKGGSPELRQAIRDDLKLDDSIPVQYANFMVKVLSGKFFISVSVFRGADTSPKIYDYAATTLALFSAVLLPAMMIGRIIAWVTSRKNDRKIWSRLVRLLSLGLAATAATSAGLVVLSLIAETSWIPMSRSLIGPWLTAFPIALGTYILIMKARSRYFGPTRTENQSELPIPTNPMTKLFVAWVMVIVILVETIFAVSGLGILMWEAVMMRDATVLIACIFLLAATIALTGFVLDLASPFVKEWIAKHGPGRHRQEAKWITSVGAKDVPREMEKDPEEDIRKNNLALDFLHHPVGLVAIVILIAFVVLAALAPVLATVKNPDSIANYEPNQVAANRLNPLPPSFEKSIYTGFIHPLGTDQRGRDVYSMLLLGTAAPLLIVAILMGVTIWAGLVFWLLAAGASRLSGAWGMMAGGFSSVAADFVISLPALLVMVMMLASQWGFPPSAYPYYFHLLVISPALVFACSFRSARVAMPIIRAFMKGGPPGRAGSGILTVMSKSTGTIFYVAKFVVIFGFLTVFLAGFFTTFMPGGLFDTSWISQTEAAFSRSSPISGAWWTYVPQLVLSALLIGSSYALLHTLEKVFVRRYGTLEETSKSAPV